MITVDLTRAARAYFKERIGGEPCGFVVFHDGTINGWCRDIHEVKDTSGGRSNGGWLAGCEAYALASDEWFDAIGGDYAHGADQWIRRAP